VSLIIGLAIHKTMGLRVTQSQEEEGLDLSQHRETAYSAA
jgi:Amt family ammonium transporter